MRKPFVILLIVVGLGVVGFYAFGRNGTTPAGGGSGRGPGGRPPRAPMTVEFTTAARAPMAEYVLVVGNLIGAATVEVVPRVSGRLQTVEVQLGDPVRRGQVIARVDDREIREQVRQAEASFRVSEASIRQRDADLKLAQTNLERSRNLLQRELLPQQAFDDTQARYEAALAQLDLSRAQFEQAKARLDELRITLANTRIESPVDGFVGKRFLDPGAIVGGNAPVVSVVDIRTVRMVANVVERDLKRVPVGTPARVEVDAFPGEVFPGKVGRVAPVFDPATRTAEMEVEVPNRDFRLKPGMYSRVQLTVGSKPDALRVPANAVVMVDGRNGVFTAAGDVQPAAQGQGASEPLTARFQAVEIGIRDAQQIEITSGLEEGSRVITTGAGALRDGDLVLPLSTGRGGGAGNTGAAGRPGPGGQPPSQGRPR
ncbi:efflux RND transporter periplasmic adaptor subunit [soil metagenome]